MNVRRATAADLDALHRLYREFFAEAPPEPEYDVELGKELGEVDAIVGAETAVVAEEGGEVVGFALARRRERGTAAILTDLYVTPAARRRGIATELVRIAVAELSAQGATHVTLWVRPDNEPAQSLYTRLGFREHMLELAVPLERLQEALGP